MTCPQVPGPGWGQLWGVTEIGHSSRVDQQAASTPPTPPPPRVTGSGDEGLAPHRCKAHVAPSPGSLPRALGGAGPWGAGWRRNVVQASRRAGFSREAASLDLEVAAPDFSKLQVQPSCPTLPVGHLPPSSHGANSGASQTLGYYPLFLQGCLLQPPISTWDLIHPESPKISGSSSWRARI